MVDKKTQAQLELCIGGFSDAGARETNQDAFAVKVPSSHSEKQYKGIVASLADGVSCSSNGQQASHTSVTQFISDYYCTPESWSVKQAASKVLSALNAWLYQQSRADLRHNGLISTFSSIVFKSTSAHIFHVGDSRIYRYRNGKLTQLTHDHSRTLHAKKSVLTRALGMDCNVDIDYQNITLQQGDVFLLSSDGVHDYLTNNWLSDGLLTISQEKCSVEQLEGVGQKICYDALHKGSNDNLTCLLIKVESLPNSDINELFKQTINLTIPPALSVGNEIDYFKIDKVIHQGARSHVYLATEQRTNKQQILKMPSLNFVDDSAYLKGFCKEQWVGQRLNQKSIMKILPALNVSSFLYHICEPIEGITLRNWMDNNVHPPLELICQIIKKIVFAARVLQRSGMVHRDLKPENIMISKNGDITLIDFGTIQIDSLEEIVVPESAEVPLGALDYIAPEYLNGGQATSLSDLFSIAVITYELLCGELPYLPSTSQSLQKARASQWQYRSIKQFRSDLPEWLDKVLEKATQPSLTKRYTAMSEFMSELSPVHNNLLQNSQSLSFLERNPLRFWQSFSFICFSVAMIELFLLLKG